MSENLCITTENATDSREPFDILEIDLLTDSKCGHWVAGRSLGTGRPFGAGWPFGTG